MSYFNGQQSVFNLNDYSKSVGFFIADNSQFNTKLAFVMANKGMLFISPTSM